MTEIAVYKEQNDSFDSITGEIKQQAKFKASRLSKEKEDAYIRVYKYMNTVFAFNNIPTSLTPYIIEFGRYMSNPEDDQIISFNKLIKDRICAVMNVKYDRLNQIIKECVKYDILRKTKYRGSYAVNPYIISSGDSTRVHELRAKFDFVSGDMNVGAVQENCITGITVKKAITNSKKQIPGQMALELELED